MYILYKIHDYIDNTTDQIVGIQTEKPDCSIHVPVNSRLNIIHEYLRYN